MSHTLYRYIQQEVKKQMRLPILVRRKSVIIVCCNVQKPHQKLLYTNPYFESRKFPEAIPTIRALWQYLYRIHRSFTANSIKSYIRVSNCRFTKFPKELIFSTSLSSCLMVKESLRHIRKYGEKSNYAPEQLLYPFNSDNAYLPPERDGCFYKLRDKRCVARFVTCRRDESALCRAATWPKKGRIMFFSVHT